MGINPTKRNRYQVIEDAIIVLDPAAIATIQIPEVDLETSEHTENNHVRETISRINVGDLVIQFYEDQANRNNFWLTKLPYDQTTGEISDPADTEFDLVIQMLAYDGVTPVRQFICKGCAVKNSSHETLEKNSTDNNMRTVTCSVVRMIEEVL